MKIENNNNENSIIFLCKKTKRNFEINEDNSNKSLNKKEKILGVNKSIKYRHDYYIIAFKTNFLEFLKKKLN